MNCRNPNLQNCFDDKTEILTKRSFVLFCELHDTIETLSFILTLLLPMLLAI